MPHANSRCLLSSATLLVALAASPAAQSRADVPSTSADEPWRLMAGLRFSEARAAFPARAEASDAERLGRALSLLGAQPKTDSNVNQAEQILAALAADATDTEILVRASFLHARVPHIHRQTDWSEAARRYLAVYEAHPAHPLGQRALVRHGIVTLFRPLPPEEFATLFDAFLAASAAIDHPDALRDLDWLLVSVHERRLGDPVATLRHLERLLAGPAPIREITRLGFLVQAGELARELGDPAKAARYYREFLQTALRDSRAYFIRQRLSEVEASS
jgi:hypothetical protein